MRVIAGRAGGHALSAFKGYKFRPTSAKVRGALFNIIGPQINGCRFLDLFAGTGAVGIEAISRGANPCYFVEKSSDALKVLKKNLVCTGFTNEGTVLFLDVFQAVKLLEKEKQVFDYIFLDPPYKYPFLTEVLHSLAAGTLVNPAGLVIVEHSAANKDWLDRQPFSLLKQKRYGDTSLTVLTQTLTS